MQLSVVTTLFKSEKYLQTFYDQISKYAKLISSHYEIILVNDGSPDHSMKIASELVQNDPHVKLINLSRNFGHHKAILTGLKYAKGEKVFLIDCDLEEDPGLLLQFNSEMKNKKADVVFGVQKQRNGGLINKFFGYLQYKIVNLLTNNTLKKDLMTVRLMTSQYVRSLLMHTEKVFNIAGLWHITGFNQVPIKVEKKRKDTSAYTFGKKIDLIIDSITAFSAEPLKYIFYLGITIFLCSLFAILYFIFRKFYYGSSVSGWTSLIVTIWFFGGLVIFCLGVVGIYCANIFQEVKNRPLAIIKSIENQDHNKELIESLQRGASQKNQV